MANSGSVPEQPRRETYATTSQRMIVRFFGSWDFESADADRPNFAEIGYEKGVPMGGDLTNALLEHVTRSGVRISKDRERPPSRRPG